MSLSGRGRSDAAWARQEHGENVRGLLQQDLAGVVLQYDEMKNKLATLTIELENIPFEARNALRGSGLEDHQPQDMLKVERDNFREQVSFKITTSE